MSTRQQAQPAKASKPKASRTPGALWRWLLVWISLLGLAACATQPPPAGPAQELSPTHLFRPTARPVIASPIVADLDGDGQLEIAVGSWDGYFYVTDTWLRDRPGWPRYSPAGFFSTPAAADLDGDGRAEIVVGSEVGKVFVWRADGRDLPPWPLDLRHRIWAGPLLLDGPAIAILGPYQMFMLDIRGRPMRGWPQPALGWGDATAASDGEILAVATLAEGVPPARLGLKDAGAVHAWRLDGRPLPGFPVRLTADADSSPALADLDGDGRAEIIVGDDAGLLHVLDQQGRELPGFPAQTGSLIEASPAIADLDGDGWLDIVAGSWDGRMYAWDRRGALLPGWPQAAGDQFISSAALVDLTGDGLPDVVAGSKDGYLYGWDGFGRTLPGFPIHLAAHVFSSPWVGDLDGDGRADVVVGANNGIHLLRDVGPLGPAVWPRFHRDARNTGYAESAP